MTRIRGAALAAVALCVAACSSSGDTVTARGMTGAERSAAGAECAQPYAPVFTQPNPIYGAPPPGYSAAPDITITRTFEPNFLTIPDQDFNGDGVSDVTEHAPYTELQIDHPDGLYVFTAGGLHVGAASLGDLDGDGQPEIGVSALGPADGEWRNYIVPSSTPPGTYEPADVGIRVRDDAYLALWNDRTAGSGVELALTTGSLVYGGTTQVFSAADVMAVAAPGDARSLDPTAVFDGAITLVNYGDGTGDLVAAQRLEPPSTVAVSVYSAGDEQPFATFTADQQRSGLPPIAMASSRGRLLTHTNSSGDTTVYWNLDDPCTPLPAAAAPTTAPPATVAGEADLPTTG